MNVTDIWIWINAKIENVEKWYFYYEFNFLTHHLLPSLVFLLHLGMTNPLAYKSWRVG